MSNNTDFSLNKNAYATFDATSLKQLIKERLDEGGIFTDQVYEGSNISAIIDIISYSYHTLLFYLNQTSSESMFNQATLYENMNRIVKLIDYKPTGYQTSLLSFNVNATADLEPGLYTIKRYSYIIINGIYYSFINDITFNKATTDIESLGSISDNNLLFQGQYFEYPKQDAIGEDYEVVSLVIKDNVNNVPINIDGRSIGIYVRDVNSGLYNEFTETNNIFLEGPSSNKYEKRLNENGYYEFKFGNGVFGKRLNQGDQIYIFYLKSDGEEGLVSANDLDGNNINLYTTPLFENIGKDIYSKNLNFLTPDKLETLAFSNDSSSTTSKGNESVEEIRENSIKLFRNSDRLVSVFDYETTINKNFSSIVDSIKAVNNNTYLNSYIKYFYDLGLDRPNDDPRFLFNQVKFTTSSNLNNLYLFMVPSIKNIDENNKDTYLTTSQKNNIINTLEEQKMLNVEIVPQDPVYFAFSLGLVGVNETLTSSVYQNTFLVVQKRENVIVNEESLKDQVNNIFINYFKSKKLGDLISFTEIVNEIKQIEGILQVKTRKISGGSVVESDNLNMVGFNLNYPDLDVNIYSTDFTLPFFKYPFLFNNTIKNNIIIENA
jgi:hypothetical protein